MVAPIKILKACAARSMLDLRVGAAFTRFQCLRLQQLYPNLFGQGHLISYGGCQFPTLGFVVDRYRQAERFVSEDFWKLQVKHAFQQPDGSRSAPVEFLWKRYSNGSIVYCCSYCTAIEFTSSRSFSVK